MQCDNEFCVYWAEKGCILREITLDIQGKCKNCLYIPFSKQELEQKRQAYQQEHR